MWSEKRKLQFVANTFFCQNIRAYNTKQWLTAISIKIFTFIYFIKITLEYSQETYILNLYLKHINILPLLILLHKKYSLVL